MTTVPSNVPASAPPQGQVPDFDHPWSIHSAILGFIGFSIAATTLTTLVRSYTRLYLLRTPGWDDYTMIAGWAAFLPLCAFAIHATPYGAGVHTWDVSPINLGDVAYWYYFGQVLYPIIVCIVKVSISLQLLRIFVVSRHGADFWVVWTFILIQVMWFVACFFVSVFHCTPIASFWNPFKSGKCLEGIGVYLIVIGVFNVTSDVLILIYPSFCLSRLQLKHRKKLGAASVFLVGLTAVIASILRTIYSVRYFRTGQDNGDKGFVVTQLYLCTAAEITAGIIAGNSVSLPGFFSAMSDRMKTIRFRVIESVRGSIVVTSKSAGDTSREAEGFL